MVFPGVHMRRFLMLLAVAGAVAMGGCVNKEEMAARQKEAFEARKKEVQAELAVVLQGWLDEMTRTLPADIKKYPKVQSPLVKWRADTFKYDWRRQVDAAVVKARFLAVASEFEAIPKFFDVMEKFWKKEVMFKDYMVAWKELKRTSSDPLAGLLADFDHTFVHVEAFYGAQDMEGDDRAIYFFRHWQVAFEFPREEKESVGEYIARLCEAKLKDYCMSVPFEDLHFALEKPYLTEARRIVQSYLEEHPGVELNRVFEQYLADVDARLSAWKDFPETLVVPTMKSRNPFTSQLLFTVDNQSIDYEGRDYLKFAKDWAASESDWKAFARALAPEIDKISEERGPENMEVALLKMDRATPMAVSARIVEAIKGTTARYVQFAGRNRSDAVAKLTKVGNLQFREVPELPVKLEVAGVGRLACRGIGQSIEDQAFPSKVGPVVYLSSSGIRTGVMKDGAVVDLVDADQPAAVKALLGSESMLLVDEKVPYEVFTTFIEPVFINCDNEVCKYPRNNEPKLGVSICR